jgi:hypothetical protein
MLIYLGSLQGFCGVARVARGGRQVHGRSTVGRWRSGSPRLGEGNAGQRGPGACGPFASLGGRCLALSSANGSRLNAPERVLGVTGRNGAGASVLGEDPWLVREKWRLKPDF